LIPLFKRSRYTIGLDIGSGLVKAAVVDHSGDVPRLTRLASRPLRSDAIVDGEIMDPPRVAATIRGVVEDLDIRGRSVVTAVGGRDVIVKKVRLPRTTAADARETLRFESAQYIPFGAENVQIDFQILDPAGEGPQMEVLLVAAKRELVNQRMALIADAGLSAAVVDVDAFALFNALEFNYPAASRGSAALVNVGHEVTTVVVHQDGIPVVSREVPFGSRQLTDDLRRSLGLSREEAESIIEARRAPTVEIEQRCYEKATELAVAVDRATAFLGIEGGGAGGVESIYLSGGGARIPRLLEAIADRTRARVEVINPVQRLDVAPEASAEVSGDTTAAMWMLPIGLALRSPV